MLLTLETLMDINEEISRLYNKESRLINKSNIESALSVQFFDYDDFNTISAKLFRNIIIAHGFQDGNKRTACVALGLINPPTCSSSTLANLAIEVAKGAYKDDVTELVSELYSENLINESFEDLNEVDKAKVITIVDEKYKKSVDELIDDINEGRFDKYDYTVSEPTNSIEFMTKDMSNGSGKVIYRYFIDGDNGEILVYVNVK